MTHVFFGLTAAATFALCALGKLPSDQLVDLAKWLVVVYAASTTTVVLVGMIRPLGPALRFDAITDADLSGFPSPEQGVSDPGNMGVFEGDVFAGQLGHGLHANYTSFVRDEESPPVVTDSALGHPIMVPADGPPCTAPHFAAKATVHRRPAASVPPNLGLPERLRSGEVPPVSEHTILATLARRRGEGPVSAGRQIVVLPSQEVEIDVDVGELQLEDRT